MPDMTSQTAAKLALSVPFQRRLSILFDSEAMAVLRESGGAANHEARIQLAKNVLYSPDAYSAVFARELVFDTNLIAAGFTVDGEGNPEDSSASDGAIRSQIATNWNAYTGYSS